MTKAESVGLIQGTKLAWTSEARETRFVSQWAKEWGDEIEFDHFYEGRPERRDRSVKLASGKIVTADGDGLPLIYIKTPSGVHFIASSWFDLK